MCLDNPFQTYWETEQSVFLSCVKIICRIYPKKIIFAIIFTWKSLVLLSNKHYFFKEKSTKASISFIFWEIHIQACHQQMWALSQLCCSPNFSWKAGPMQQQACPTIDPGEGSTGGYTALRSWLGQSQDSSRCNTQHPLFGWVSALTLSALLQVIPAVHTQHSPRICSIPCCSTDGLHSPWLRFFWGLL